MYVMVQKVYNQKTDAEILATAKAIKAAIPTKNKKLTKPDIEKIAEKHWAPEKDTSGTEASYQTEIPEILKKLKKFDTSIFDEQELSLLVLTARDNVAEELKKTIRNHITIELKRAIKQFRKFEYLCGIRPKQDLEEKEGIDTPD
jgi:hypothetical protein